MAAEGSCLEMPQRRDEQEEEGVEGEAGCAWRRSPAQAQWEEREDAVRMELVAGSRPLVRAPVEAPLRRRGGEGAERRVCRVRELPVQLRSPERVPMRRALTRVRALPVQLLSL